MNKSTHKAITHISVLDAHSPKHAPKQVAGRDFYALSYRFSGEVILEANGERIRSTPDTVTFTPKGMSYITEIKEDTHMIVIHFRLSEDVDFRTPHVLSATGTELADLFIRIKESYRVSDPLDFECMSLFYRLLAALERLKSAERTPVSCISRAKEILDSRFFEAELSISSVAALIGVSDSYLRRGFRSAYGEGALDYLLRLRIRHAKNLLQSEFYTVSEIALRCGFHSSTYFIQGVRAQTGETPNAYRMRHRGI